jgi:NAD(P)-dependent dehydrogenase (short-subunit alcohol dehydrogenase family)
VKGTSNQQSAQISFAGKVVLVTRAAAGVGRATALAFGRAGACVVVADTSVDGGHASAAMIVEAGGKALFVNANVSHAAEVEALVEKTINHYGRLDCAVNIAGIDDVQHQAAEGDEAQFDRIMNVNVKAVWLCMRQQLRKMVEQGSGAIVNIAPASAPADTPLRMVHAASKQAVLGLTRSAAVDYARSGVRINSLCPGAVRTTALVRMLEREPQLEQVLTSAYPMGRLAEPAEVANAVMWLCSEQASFVTGHQLAIDGGLTAL